MNQKIIPIRVSNGIINSLAAGVVPRVGLEYMAVGRKNEIYAMTNILDEMKMGASMFKIVCGRYGSGKTFFLQMIREYALKNGFVVADADLSPDKLLFGTKRQGVNTYRELMSRLSTSSSPDSGALELILQKWINDIRLDAMTKGFQEDELNNYVKKEILRTISRMKESAHGFSFAMVLSAYWEGYQKDEELKENAVRWLRGEFNTRSEAKKALAIDEVINDDNWYEFIKLIGKFFRSIGYCGFLVFFDESINLFKIPNRITREKNYEKLLSLYNDTIQGRVEALGFIFAAIPQVVHDERKGLYSYEAFRSRLIRPLIEKEGYVDPNAPVIYLSPLTNEETLILLEKVLCIFKNNKKIIELTHDDLLFFMEKKYNKIGAEMMMTPREILRDYIAVLNILQQYPHLSMSEIMKCDGENGNTANKFDLDDVVIEF